MGSQEDGQLVPIRRKNHEQPLRFSGVDNVTIGSLWMADQVRRLMSAGMDKTPPSIGLGLPQRVVMFVKWAPLAISVPLRSLKR